VLRVQQIRCPWWARVVLHVQAARQHTATSQGPRVAGRQQPPRRKNAPTDCRQPQAAAQSSAGCQCGATPQRAWVPLCSATAWATSQPNDPRPTNFPDRAQTSAHNPPTPPPQPAQPLPLARSPPLLPGAPNIAGCKFTRISNAAAAGTAAFSLGSLRNTKQHRAGEHGSTAMLAPSPLTNAQLSLSVAHKHRGSKQGPCGPGGVIRSNPWRLGSHTVLSIGTRARPPSQPLPSPAHTAAVAPTADAALCTPNSRTQPFH
jgi:hypothetical protein